MKIYVVSWLLNKSRFSIYPSSPEFARHWMASVADIDDLTVLSPMGERCRFHMEVETIEEAGRERMVIRELVREVR